MMKRLISLLLSLCIVAGLFACMTTTAYADGDTQKYTVVSGDNLYAICAKLKVDYAKNLNWIVNTNNLKNPDKLDVGQVLTMPAEGKILTWTGSASTSTSTSTASSSSIMPKENTRPPLRVKTIWPLDESTIPS